jgi:hypothetical protein
MESLLGPLLAATLKQRRTRRWRVVLAMEVSLFDKTG